MLRQCGITGNLLDEIHTIPDMVLQSLLIAEDYDVVPTVPDSELLAYANGRGPRPVDLQRTRVICSASTHDAASIRFQTSRYRRKKTHDSVYTEEEIVTMAEHVFPNTEHDASDPILDQQDRQEKLRKVKLGGKDIPEAERQGSEDSSIDNLQHGSIGELRRRSLPVTLWLFKHPDGRCAVGEEPLEWFSDWEGSDGGMDDEFGSDGMGSADEEYDSAVSDDGFSDVENADDQ